MIATWTPAVGLRVDSPTFGKGLVVRVTPHGAVVRFDVFGIEVEQPLDRLRPDPAEVPPAAPLPLAVPTPSSALTAEQTGARQAVDALRFGLVPQHALESLTLGFAELRDWILARLPGRHAGRPRAAAVFGQFGTGKSHAMAVIRHVAQCEGYVTARVEVDGKRVSLSEPERLLYALWQTLRASGWHSSTPLLDLYLRAIQAGHAPPSIAPRGIDRVRHNYAVARHLLRTGRIDEHGYALDALISSSDEFTASQVQRQIGGVFEEGKSFSVKRVIGNAVGDRPYDFVEALAGHATVARLAGYRGLVVTVDEFEVERALLTTRGYSRVKEFVAVLTNYLQGRTDHRAAPLALFFATVGEAGHAGDTVIEGLLAADDGAAYRLQPWPPEALRLLAERIHTLYHAAYGIAAPFDPALAGQVAEDFDVGDDGVIRAFIKRYVGALDARYGPPWA